MDIKIAIVFSLGLYFVSSGITKVLPLQPLHDRVKTNFDDLATVCPWLCLGLNIEPDVYRSMIGISEITMGTLLAFGTQRAVRISSIGLLIVTSTLLYSLTALSTTTISSLFLPGICLIALLWSLKKKAEKRVHFYEVGEETKRKRFL